MISCKETLADASADALIRASRFSKCFSPAIGFFVTLDNFKKDGYKCVLGGNLKYPGEIPPGYAVWDVTNGFLRIWYRSDLTKIQYVTNNVDYDALSESQKSAGVFFGKDGPGYEHIIAPLIEEEIENEYSPKKIFFEQYKGHMFRVTVTNDGNIETVIYDLVEDVEDDLVEDVEDDLVEDELVEDELVEADLVEDDLVETEDELSEDELVETEDDDESIIFKVISSVMHWMLGGDHHLSLEDIKRKLSEGPALSYDDIVEIVRDSLGPKDLDGRISSVISRVFWCDNIDEDDFEEDLPKLIDFILKEMELTQFEGHPVSVNVKPSVFNTDIDSSGYDPIFLGPDGLPTEFYTEYMVFALGEFVASKFFKEVLRGENNLGKGFFLFLTHLNTPAHIKLLCDNNVCTYTFLMGLIAQKIYGSVTVSPMEAVYYRGTPLSELLEGIQREHLDPKSIMKVRFTYRLKEMKKPNIAVLKTPQKVGTPRRQDEYHKKPTTQFPLGAFTVKKGR
jgi:hypothetical protein